MTLDSRAPTPAASSGSFGPLRQPVFAVLWAATLMGNIGSFMRDVASSWMVTELSPSPTAVALIQTAASLPAFLLAIPAGVLSDILDRRRLLIAMQLMLACVSGTLLVMARNNALTVEWLIALTFIGGIGGALMAPTWQSIVPELVPRADLKNAVTLNSLGVNIARAVGPAAGGLLLASFGASVAYGADVMSYVFVVGALLWWRRTATVDTGLSETFFGAFRAGIRYARSSRDLHRVLLRSAVFFLFASAAWALLPLVARRLLGGDAGFYGLMLGGVGTGAILGAVLLPRLRASMSSDGLVLLAAALTAVVVGGLALSPPRFVAVPLMLLLGAGWIIALTTFSSVAQAVLPNWVRGRGLAIYLMVFNGAMAAGSLGWGLVAQALGLPATLMIGAVGMLAAGWLMHRVRLPVGDADLMPSNHWAEPLLDQPVEHDRGPVLIQIEYRIRQADRPAFLAALNHLSHERRRDGAYAWGVVEDASQPERVVEWFLVESWAEHLRQHQRVSKADADLQQDTLRWHIGPNKPVVQHFLALDPAHPSAH